MTPRFPCQVDSSNALNKQQGSAGEISFRASKYSWHFIVVGHGPALSLFVLAVGMPHFRGLASVIALPQDCTATPEIWIDLRLTDMSDTIDDSTHFHTLMPSCRVSPDVTGVASEQTIAHSTTQ